MIMDVSIATFVLAMWFDAFWCDSC